MVALLVELWLTYLAFTQQVKYRHRRNFNHSFMLNLLLKHFKVCLITSVNFGIIAILNYMWYLSLLPAAKQGELMHF